MAPSIQKTCASSCKVVSSFRSAEEKIKMHLFTPLLLAMAALASNAAPAPPQQPEVDISTLCPEIFAYEVRDKPGQWSGKLHVISEDDLQGVWIRLLFDRSVEDLAVEGDYDVLKDDQQPTEFLIKNRHVLLKANQEITLKINVKYAGEIAPYITQYRLNARTVCPEQYGQLLEYFEGDAKSPDYFSAVISKSGIPSSKPTYRCGEKSSEKHHPWHANLYVNDQYVCEGALIDSRHVLTPAHCVASRYQDRTVPPRFLSIYLGQHGAAKGAVRANVSKVLIHPGYEAFSVSNDLAVVKLGHEVKIDDDVMPICLENNDVEGSLVVGFKIEQEAGEEETLEAKVRKISNEECLKKDGQVHSLLTDETYCLGYLSDNVNCAGNSGSTFISLKDNKAALKGVVSLGPKLQNKSDCSENTVVVVTDISRYSKWIQRSLKL